MILFFYDYIHSKERTRASSLHLLDLIYYEDFLILHTEIARKFSSTIRR